MALPHGDPGTIAFAWAAQKMVIRNITFTLYTYNVVRIINTKKFTTQILSEYIDCSINVKHYDCRYHKLFIVLNGEDFEWRL